VQHRPEANQNEGNIIWKSLEEKSLEKDGERATKQAKPDLHEGQNHATLLEDTQVWGKSWEQVVVDATLWRTAPAVVSL
jgi:hypothetical protein